MLIEGNVQAREFWCSQYDHVLVDEYQDVNRSSVRLLTAICPTGKNLWVVGDAKQSIYRFRGASPFNIARFGKEDFASGETERLERSYRSVAEVVDAFSVFALQMSSGGESAALESDRGPSGGLPAFKTVEKAEHVPVAVAEMIESMRAAGHAYRDQAILCRGNDKLAELGQDLERLGIPVLFLGSLFERPEIRDLVALLSILVDRRAMGLVSVACSPNTAMNMSDVAAVLDHLRSAEAPPGKWLDAQEPIQGLSAGGGDAIRKLKAMLAGFDHTSPPWAVLAAVLMDRTRIAAAIGASDNVGQRTRGMAIWQFMNFLRIQPPGRGLPIQRVMERIRRLLRLSDERDLRQLPAAAQGIDAVRLMTMHGAKGLEFEVVHIPHLTAASMPGSPLPQPCPPPLGMIDGAKGTADERRRADHAEEQECLFYVALSRARDRLLMYAPTLTSDGKNRKPSPFIARLGTKVTAASMRPDRELPPAPESADIPLSILGRLSFENTQVSLYESCPRRFFYAHVLQVGGRRTSTAFMQMHEAVRHVFKAVVDSSEPLTDVALDQMVDEALHAQTLSDHGYADSYRSIALAMRRYFVGTRSGHEVEKPSALSLQFGEEVIIVRPDDMLIGGDGRRTLRRIQTGHKRSKNNDDVAAAAFLLAARNAFPDALVELVHLSDESCEPIAMTTKVLSNRHRTVGDFLTLIRAGRFPARTSAQTCPKCPAFFICGPTPPGSLERVFEK